ncbi:hypothetical protein [Roseicitreum antarcticum]|uniref:Uncharacterized protein n=1 Tax=Roseicitreum antarcticum TaxID=564137 RepID=A0A1H2TWQ3_9RHOB|nr:hypothetical protein [Roseicitreum antarcticum]SDW48345.1 hypothetical protein SAMN04488238_102205 [Roseicitreum antarcticum]
MHKFIRPVAVLGVLALAGCTAYPGQMGGFSAPRTTAPSTIAVTPAPAGSFPDMGAPVPASEAERACLGAAQERGLTVRSVVGSRAVAGSDGDSGRDVMLRVARSGQEYEVRCNYAGATQSARIMSL